jgi:hypothetical protein
LVEHIVRRVIQIEKAVARNPRAPDYTGLHVITQTGVDGRGAAHAPAFDSFIANEQQREAQVLKQNRLWSEEQAKASASSSYAVTPPDGDIAPRARPTPKPKPKPKGQGKDGA